MGGWDHAPSTATDDQTAETSARNARYGLWLFLLYCVAYAVFVLLNAFVPDSMTLRPVAGLTLSVLYGLTLIALAFLLALVYGWLCRANLSPASGERDSRTNVATTPDRTGGSS